MSRIYEQGQEQGQEQIVVASSSGRCISDTGGPQRFFPQLCRTQLLCDGIVQAHEWLPHPMVCS